MAKYTGSDADLDTLKAFLTSDPTLSPWVADNPPTAPDYAEAERLMNEPNIETGVDREDVPLRDVMEAVEPGDWPADAAKQRLWLALTQRDPVPNTPNVKAGMQDVFAGTAGGTLAALAALQTTTGSRFEKLFIEGDVCGKVDIVAAMARP